MPLRGLGLGAAFGGVYGVALLELGAVVTVIRDSLDGLPPTPEPFERLLSLLASVLVVVPFGLIGGIFFGGCIGPVLGAPCGLVLFALTRIFFWHRPDARRHREVAGRASALAAVAILLSAWAASGLDPNALVHPQPDTTGYFFDNGPVDAALVTVLPALVAGAAARFAGRKVAGWWSGTTAGRSGEDDPAATA